MVMNEKRAHMADLFKLFVTIIIIGCFTSVFGGDSLAQPTLATPQLLYSPVDEGVRLIWDSRAERTRNPLEPNPDFEGYRIFRAQYNIDQWLLIGAFDSVNDSVYVIDERGDTLNNGQPVDLPPICHSYIDTGGPFLGKQIARPINGLPYFYSVVAYSTAGDETGKDNYQKCDDGTAMPVYPTKRYETGQQQSSLDSVKVVPNPYKASSLFEVRYEDKIMFTNLPPAAEISIYTLDGDIVKTILHESGTDSEKWNLTSKNNQFVVSGLYYYVVRTDTEKKIGKFVIMR